MAYGSQENTFQQPCLLLVRKAKREDLLLVWRQQFRCQVQIHIEERVSISFRLFFSLKNTNLKTKLERPKGIVYERSCFRIARLERMP